MKSVQIGIEIGDASEGTARVGKMKAIALHDQDDKLLLGSEVKHAPEPLRDLYFRIIATPGVKPRRKVNDSAAVHLHFFEEVELLHRRGDERFNLHGIVDLKMNVYDISRHAQSLAPGLPA